jgi:5-formyltetrahydrofolate cyclo-ligase
MTAHAGGAALLSDRSLLRTEMRRRRRALSADERASASRQFARILRRSNLLRPGRHIAVYAAHDAEADPSAIVSLARRNGCKLYLPAIADYRRRRMEFRPYSRAARLRPNRYGIAEPVLGAPRVAVRQLDLVLLPLVAVDPSGTRLGTGAGFYDRCLQHLRTGRRWRRPKLIGLGYEFQRVGQLAACAWDVPLDALLTEKDLYALKGSP